MSGIEAVVGLVFGVLPLVISAAEHYEVVFRPFKQYKNFGPELKRLEQEFFAHKSVFRNECLILLSSLTDSDTAKKMLEDQHHPLRSDNELKQKFSRRLGSSCLACIGILELINEELKLIEDESRKFEVVITESMPLELSSRKAWLLRVRKKLQFIISNSRICRHLEGLDKFNRIFLTLSAQTTKLVDKEIHSRQPTLSPSKHTSIKQSQLVQEAATQLPDVLARACSSHPEHSANFLLDPIHTSATIVRFNVAYTEGCKEDTRKSDHVGILIESILNDNVSKDNIEEGANQSLWSPFQHSLEQVSDLSFDAPQSKKRRLKKYEKEKNPSTLEGDQAAKTSTSYACARQPSDIAAESSFLDFCECRNFCIYIQRSSLRTPKNPDGFIGYLQKLGTWRHRVYYSPSTSSIVYKNSVSLGQIVGSMSSKSSPYNRILGNQRVRLARQLASAVLYFYATPILDERWCSEDIVFFPDASSDEDKSWSLTAPHLNVRIQTLQKEEKSHRCRKTTKGLIRNPYTFALGVILIEIAYQAPLLSFKESIDSTHSREESDTEFYIAHRLSDSLSTELGVSYKRLVQRCLACDFGQGNDLRNPDLQEVFCRDVICELERLESLFTDLQVNDNRVR